MHPERVSPGLKRWNPVETPNLTFEDVDEDTFLSLKLAREAARVGGTLPCALNAANEEAANAFLRGEVSFLGIPEVVEKTMAAHRVEAPTLESLLATDEASRRFARNLMWAHDLSGQPSAQPPHPRDLLHDAHRARRGPRGGPLPVRPPLRHGDGGVRHRDVR